MSRHAPLTDAQRAAVADRAVEQVADTLVKLHDDSQSGQRKPLSDGDTSGHRT